MFSCKMPPGEWTLVNKKGKVRGMSGPSTGGAGQGRGGGGGDPVSSGSRSGGTKQLTKLKPMETRANFSERPNTVMIDGKGFLFSHLKESLPTLWMKPYLQRQNQSSYSLRSSHSTWTRSRGSI